MKKLFLFFLLALSVMQGRAQLLVDADYNAAGDKIEVTLKNMSDSLTLIFCGERMPNPDAQMEYVEMEDGSTFNYPLCMSSILPGNLFFLHPGEKWLYVTPLPKGSRVRAFSLVAGYWRANMPKEEWGKDIEYKMKNWRKHTLPGRSSVEFLRTIK